MTVQNKLRISIPQFLKAEIIQAHIKCVESHTIILQLVEHSKRI